MRVSSNRIITTTVDINVPPISFSVYFTEWQCAFVIYKSFWFLGKGENFFFASNEDFFFQRTSLRRKKILLKKIELTKFMSMLELSIYMEIIKAIPILIFLFVIMNIVPSIPFLSCNHCFL